MFNFFGDLANLLNPTITTADARVTWVRISDWLPWMKMGGREGMIYFNTTGLKLDNFDQMPAALSAELIANYPTYAASPRLKTPAPTKPLGAILRTFAKAKRYRQRGRQV
jgi:hypothetical protein